MSASQNSQSDPSSLRSSVVDLLRAENSRYAAQVSVSSENCTTRTRDDCSDSGGSFWDERRGGESDESDTGETYEFEKIKPKIVNETGMGDGMEVFKAGGGNGELAAGVKSFLDDVKQSNEVSRSAVDALLSQVSQSGKYDSGGQQEMVDYINKVTKSLYDNSIEPLLEAIPHPHQPEIKPNTDNAHCTEIPKPAVEHESQPAAIVHDTTVQVFPTNRSLVEARFRERGGKAAFSIDQNSSSHAAQSSLEHSRNSDGHSEGVVQTSGPVMGKNCMELNAFQMESRRVDTTTEHLLNGGGGFGNYECEIQDVVQETVGALALFGETDSLRSACQTTSEHSEQNSIQRAGQGKQAVQQQQENVHDRHQQCLEGCLTQCLGLNAPLQNGNLIAVASMVASAATAAVSAAFQGVNNSHKIPDVPNAPISGCHTNTENQSRPSTRQAHIVRTPAQNFTEKTIRETNGIDSVGGCTVEQLLVETATQTGGVGHASSGNERECPMSKDCQNLVNFREDKPLEVSWKHPETSVPRIEYKPVTETAEKLSQTSERKVEGKFVSNWGVSSEEKKVPIVGNRQGGGVGVRADLPAELKESLSRTLRELDPDYAVDVKPIPSLFDEKDETFEEAERMVRDSLGGEFGYSTIRSELNGLRESCGFLSKVPSSRALQPSSHINTVPPVAEWNCAKTWDDIQQYRKSTSNEVLYRMSVRKDPKAPAAQPVKRVPCLTEQKPVKVDVSKRTEKTVQPAKTLTAPLKKPRTAAGLTDSQRLLRKRCTPDRPVQNSQGMKQLSRSLNRPKSPVSKKPRQRPCIAFGSRVQQKQQPPAAPPKMKKESEQVKHRTVGKQPDRRARPESTGKMSVVPSSCGETDEMVEDLLEALLEATKGQNDRVLGQLSALMNKSVSDLHGIDENSPVQGCDNASTIPRAFLSMTDISEPPIPGPFTEKLESKDEAQTEEMTATKSTRGGGGSHEIADVIDDVISNGLTTALKHGGAVEAQEKDTNGELIACRTSNHASERECSGVEHQPSTVPIANQGNNLDDSILDVLVSALLEANISAINETKRDTKPLRTASAPTHIQSVVPEPINYGTPHHVSESPPAPSWNFQPTLQAPEIAPASQNPPPAVLPTPHETSHIPYRTPISAGTTENARTDPTQQTDLVDPTPVPCPRVPLAVKPHTATESSESLFEQMEVGDQPSRSISSRQSSGRHIEDSSDSFRVVGTPNSSVVCSNQAPTDIDRNDAFNDDSDDSASIERLMNEFKRIAVGCTEESSVCNDDNVEMEGSCKDDHFSLTEAKAETSVTKNIEPSAVKESREEFSTAKAERYLPPAPPPGIPSSIHHSTARRLWRPDVQYREERESRREDATPPSSSDFYGSGEESTSMDDTNREGRRLGIRGGGNLYGLRLGKFRARRRYLLEKAGIHDPLLVTSTTDQDDTLDSSQTDDSDASEGLEV